MNDSDRTHNGHGPARASRGNTKILPEYLVRFLELLRRNGNVTLSAERIGWSRSTIYAFAAKAPSFKEAMREALTEGRELLLGEGWRRATTWSEFDDAKEGHHVKPPSDRLLAILIQGYFQEFKPGREDDAPGDELIPETLDLTLLTDQELEVLEGLLVKLGADDRRPRAS